VDIVSKNGALLLNIGPRPDGTIPEEEEAILLDIGRWLALNGEAIYATVPWKIFAEGHTEKLECFQYQENRTPSRGIQPDPSKLNWEDVRFTRNGEHLYATVLGVSPSGVANIKSLSKKTSVSKSNKIKSVELLGSGPVEWKRTNQALEIQLPETLPNEWALSFKITVDGELDKSKPDVDGSRMKLPKQT
jgi:alpha-L-fucosidase